MNGRPYTEEEKQFIQENYGKMTWKEIADKLGRTEEAVSRKFSYWGLSKSKYVVTNEYINKGDYTKLIVKNINTGETYISKVDNDMVDYLKGIIWNIHNNGYLSARINNHIEFIHRIIFGLWCGDTDICVDHINLDKLDNRRCNLRKCLKKENNQNLGISIKNSSGYRGVCKDHNCWKACVKHNGRQLILQWGYDLEELNQIARYARGIFILTCN